MIIRPEIGTALSRLRILTCRYIIQSILIFKTLDNITFETAGSVVKYLRLEMLSLIIIQLSTIGLLSDRLFSNIAVF